MPVPDDPLPEDPWCLTATGVRKHVSGEGRDHPDRDGEHVADFSLKASGNADHLKELIDNQQKSATIPGVRAVLACPPSSTRWPGRQRGRRAPSIWGGRTPPDIPLGELVRLCDITPGASPAGASFARPVVQGFEHRGQRSSDRGELVLHVRRHLGIDDAADHPVGWSTSRSAGTCLRAEARP